MKHIQACFAYGIPIGMLIGCGLMLWLYEGVDGRVEKRHSGLTYYSILKIATDAKNGDKKMALLWNNMLDARDQLDPQFQLAIDNVKNHMDSFGRTK